VERQANIIATALLMPTGQVKRAFYAIRNKPDFIELLAKKFGVSVQAMRIFAESHNMT
jgi:Zn-dependent peptidase ImmA (M78 family)